MQMQMQESPLADSNSPTLHKKKEILQKYNRRLSLRVIVMLMIFFFIFLERIFSRYIQSGEMNMILNL